MSATVTTPRAVYPTMTALAQQLECRTRALYLHITERGANYVLLPLNEAAYQRWHATVYALAQEAKATL